MSGRSLLKTLAGRKRRNKDLPPDLSELMKKLIKHAASFIRVFDDSKPKMRQIVEEFYEIAKEVKGMQETTEEVKTGGAVTAGVGLGLMILAAPFTGGASLAIGAGATVAAAGGSAVVVGTNMTKIIKENRSAGKVEKLEEEFMEIVELLGIDLIEIMTMCEKLEQRSAEVQAGNTLSDIEEFQRILRRVSELLEKSKEMEIGDPLTHIVKVFTVTASPEEDKKLRDAIIQSADQCEKIVVEFDEMKNNLKKFKEQ